MLVLSVNIHQEGTELPQFGQQILKLSKPGQIFVVSAVLGKLQGCEVGAVKVRVHRAMNELREIFRELESKPIPMQRRL